MSDIESDGTDWRKSMGYLTWAEWGPAATIPRDERLAEQYPEVSADERAEWIDDFKKVDQIISNLAYGGAEIQQTRETFAELVRSDCPFMDRAAIDKAWFLTNYYHWHG